MMHRKTTRRRTCGTPYLQAGEITSSINDGVETFNFDVEAIPNRILVADLEASLGLFRDLLGLKVVGQQRLDSKRFGQLVGKQCSGVRATVMGLGRVVFGTAALLEFEDHDGKVFSPFNRDADRLISGAFAKFRTNEIDEIFKKVERADYEIVYPPCWPCRSSDFETKSREFLFRGSESLLVKLVDHA